MEAQIGVVSANLPPMRPLFSQISFKSFTHDSAETHRINRNTPAVPLVEAHKKGFARMSEAQAPSSSNNSSEAGPDRSDSGAVISIHNGPLYGISVTTNVEQRSSPRKASDMEAGLNIRANAWQAPTVSSGH